MNEGSTNPDVRSKALIESRTRRGLRFSLRTLLATVAVLAVVGSHVHTSWRLQRSEVQVRRLRNELGHLIVEDESLVHVVSVPTLERTAWKWRLFIPRNQSYELHLASRQIAETGFPTSSSTITLPLSGEVPLTMDVHRDAKGEWLLTLETPGGSVSVGIADEDVQWIGHGHQESKAGNGATQSFEPDRPVELLRLRGAQRHASGGRPPIQDPTDGIVLWLTRESQSPPP